MIFRTFIFFTLLISQTLFAQPIVTGITFEGLKKTKSNYLIQFIKTKVGIPLDSNMVEADRQRLVNLEIITQAAPRYEVSENGILVTFDCEESLTILPSFSVGSIQENTWVRIGFQHTNLAGTGNKVTTFYQYYDRHSGGIYYEHGRRVNSPFAYTLSATKWSSLEPTQINSFDVNYQYNNYQTAGSIRYYLTFTNSVELGLNGFYENYSKTTDDEFLPGPDQVSFVKALFRFTWQNDKLNYDNYYTSGWKNNLTIQTVRTFREHIPFVMIVNELQLHKRLYKCGNLAFRLRTGIATNNNSPFAPFALDSYLNIRGVGNRIDRGTASFVLNSEYRHTAYDKRNIAVQLVAFVDAGTWRKPGGSLSDAWLPAARRIFKGVGIRFIDKRAFNRIFRVDYGSDLNSTGGFVLGVGQYF
jgi:outer membrane protein insertion porin family